MESVRYLRGCYKIRMISKVVILNMCCVKINLMKKTEPNIVYISGFVTDCSRYNQF